jgi:sugar lactone lactonase YvrE
MTVEVFDDRACMLGEGPLWHPTRAQLFWFDIISHRLLTLTEDGPQEWQFDRAVSAAGWVDHDRLLIASDEDLFVFDLRDSTSQYVVTLEADNPMTRSNDGRADPQGGFWIGTMGHHAEPGAGALYRYYQGELRKLRGKVTIPNATCFTPDGGHAYFADTAEQIVWRYSLDEDGWPEGAPDVFLDLRGDDLNPDGAIVAADGTFYCAQWGASRVAVYDPSGSLVEEISLPVPQPTCPSLTPEGLFVTTARQGLPGAAIDAAPLSGQTLRIATKVAAQPEHRVIL